VGRDVVRPNEELDFFTLGEVTYEDARVSGAARERIDSLRFEFSFIDTEGRRWVRSRDGKLGRGRR
jgi:hypothetical protein